MESKDTNGKDLKENFTMKKTIMAIVLASALALVQPLAATMILLRTLHSANLRLLLRPLLSAIPSPLLLNNLLLVHMPKPVGGSSDGLYFVVFIRACTGSLPSKPALRRPLLRTLFRLHSLRPLRRGTVPLPKGCTYSPHALSLRGKTSLSREL